MLRLYEKNKNKIEYVCDRLIWWLAVSLIPVIGIFDNHVLMMRLYYGLTGAAVCLILIKENKSFRPGIRLFHVMVGFFIGFCYASGIWGWDTGYPFSTAGYIFRMFACTTVFYYYFEKKDSVEEFIQAIKIGGYILVYCCIIGFHPVNIMDILIHGGRLVNEFVCHIAGQKVPGLFHGIFTTNINFLGILVVYPTVIGFYEVIFGRKKIAWELIGLLPAVLFLIISGGKTNFLILFAGMIMILLLRTKCDSIKKTVIRRGIIFCIGLVMIYVASFLPIFQTTFNRFIDMLKILQVSGESAADGSTNVRADMIRVGIEQFFKTPLGGIGVDNARFLWGQKTGRNDYLHCNYVELLAGVGAIGTIAYYLCYLYPLYQFWKYRKFANEHTAICTIIILLFFLADISNVPYTCRATYLYFALFFIHAEKLKDQANSSKKNGKE